MRYTVTLSYNGLPFSGWQIQPSAPSVQGFLQDALTRLLGTAITVTGAGRTDSKVNAIGYKAHFDAPGDIDSRRLTYKLNAILPSGIVIHGVEAADDDFHARFDACSRQYKYFINRKKDPFVENFSYRFGYGIDVDKMNRAAAKLIGTKDFSCFEKVGGQNANSICTLTQAHWDSYTPDHVREMGYPAEEGDYLVFTVSANRFLRNMVRAIVGTLLDIGRGRHPEEWMDEVLASGNRCAAGDSVPGHALFLTKVDYPEK